MDMTEGVVHFSVESGIIMALARDKVLCRDWRGALRVLGEVTEPPLTLDQAVAILAGKSALVDDPQQGLCLADQDPACPNLKRYLQTAHWQQAGILERDGEFYQPYAEIIGFTQEDLRPVLAQLEDQENWITAEAFRQARARHYMERPFDDIACFDTGSHPVLMKRVQGPAFWMPTFTDTAGAMAHWREHRKGDLEQLGGDRYGVPASSLDFYLKVAMSGALSGSAADLPEDESALLDTILDMRAEFDDNPKPDDNPWRSNESRFEDAVMALVYKHRVDRQAETMGGFLVLQVKAYRDDEPTEYRVARAPFQIWAQQYGYKAGALPEWKRVCPSGLKMGGDNPTHTDWWVSSGLPLRAAYDHDHPLNKAAWKLAHRWQDSTGEKCLKLAGKGKVTGPVVFPKPHEGVLPGSIAVVTHAGPEYELALLSACKGESGAVIAQVGGKLAHLAIVSREMGARLVVVDEALTKFKEGELVTLDLDTGDVRIHGRESRLDDYDD
jgi:phosphohistidine swiveling domain-containing protein